MKVLEKNVIVDISINADFSHKMRKEQNIGNAEKPCGCTHTHTHTHVLIE